MSKSDTVGVILFVFLLIFSGVLVYSTYITRKEYQTISQENIIYNFSALEGQPLVVDPTNNPTPQIQCPAGTEINIIDAKYEVYDPLKQCTSKPMPDSTGTSITNAICGPGGKCQIADATGYLALKCNGLDTCNVVVNSDSFGPIPCSGVAPITCTSSTSSSAYCQLPVSSNKRGYYGHGIYTCMPKK